MSEPIGVAARDGSNSHSHCRQYLETLYSGASSDAYVEIRMRITRGMRSMFVPVTRLKEAANLIERQAQLCDVFVGVVPRARCGGRRADLVPSASVIWADCDAPQSAAALVRFLPKPSLTVASGSAKKVHAYWLLEQPIPLDALELANRQLARLLGADSACTDAGRILRPPDTLNYKHDPPRPVALVDSDPTRRYALGTIVDADYQPEHRVHQPRARFQADGDRLLAVEPARYVELLAGLSVSRSRKVRCPFHEDRTPSLHVYDESDRGWFCFGCRRGGSIYDFAALLWDCSTRDNDFLVLRERLRSELQV